MLEALFGLAAPAPKKDVKKSASAANIVQVAILEARKAHNFSIQLRALGLTKHEVIGALLDGSGSFVSFPLPIMNCFGLFKINVAWNG